MRQIAKKYFSTEDHPDGSYKRCHRWMVKHMKRGQIKRSTGIVNGEIVHVYCTKFVSAVEHELRLTDVCDLYAEYAAIREKNMPHMADAKLKINNISWWIEMDMDTENVKQTKGRLMHYRVLPKNEFVLFVCPDEKRAKQIRDMAPDETTHHLYTVVYDKLMADPWGMVLTDCNDAEDCVGTNPHTCPSATPTSDALSSLRGDERESMSSS
jgi:hypothetical protein